MWNPAHCLQQHAVTTRHLLKMSVQCIMRGSNVTYVRNRVHRQLELSDGLEPSDKRLGYRRALARAYLSSGQPQEAILHLQELLKDDSITPTDRLDLLCNLADAQVTSTWLPRKTVPS